MSIGIWQVLLILVIVLILFGAGQLPKVMGDIAKGVKNFRAGMREDSSSETDQSPNPHTTIRDESATTANSTLRKEDTVSRS